MSDLLMSHDLYGRAWPSSHLSASSNHRWACLPAWKLIIRYKEGWLLQEHGLKKYSVRCKCVLACMIFKSASSQVKKVRIR